MNKKIFKALFIISFIPYVILLLISLYYAFFGYDVYTLILPVYVKTIYGVEAFLETLTVNVLTLFYIPIIPILLIYQIAYIIYLIIKKVKEV